MQTKYKYIDYCSEVSKAMSSVNPSRVDKAVDCMINARTVFFCGNGGSAANASHFSQDVFKFCFDNHILKKTFSLVDSIPIITATSNDSNYSLVFSNVLSTFGTRDDVLVAISGSGNSGNIIKAAKAALSKGMPVISMTGFSGGALCLLATHAVHVDCNDMGIVEGVHSILIHYITNEIVRRMKEDCLL